MSGNKTIIETQRAAAELRLGSWTWIVRSNLGARDRAGRAKKPLNPNNKLFDIKLRRSDKHARTQATFPFFSLQKLRIKLCFALYLNLSSAF